MATRNLKSFGLFGERAFSDFNNTVRLRETLAYQQQGWPGTMQVELRFRRLYFDGKLAGRFEFGFIIESDAEETVCDRIGDFAYDVARLAAATQEIPLVVRSLDGRQHPATIGTCGAALGLAYVMATTRQSALSEFLPSEIYGKAVAVGHPTIQIRVSEGRSLTPIEIGGNWKAATAGYSSHLLTGRQSATM